MRVFLRNTSEIRWVLNQSKRVFTLIWWRDCKPNVYIWWLVSVFNCCCFEYLPAIDQVLAFRNQVIQVITFASCVKIIGGSLKRYSKFSGANRSSLPIPHFCSMFRAISSTVFTAALTSFLRASDHIAGALYPLSVENVFCRDLFGLLYLLVFIRSSALPYRIAH